MIKHPYNELFSRLWDASPRRGSKRNAETAFLRLRPDEGDMPMLLDAMQWQVQEYKEEHPDDTKFKYFPHTSSWLNGEYYDKERPMGAKDCVDCGARYEPDKGFKYTVATANKAIKEYKCSSCRNVGGNVRIG